MRTHPLPSEQPFCRICRERHPSEWNCIVGNNKELLGSDAWSQWVRFYVTTEAHDRTFSGEWMPLGFSNCWAPDAVHSLAALNFHNRQRRYLTDEARRDLKACREACRAVARRFAPDMDPLDVIVQLVSMESRC